MARTAHHPGATAVHPLLPYRSSILSLIKLLFLGLLNLPMLHASPLRILEDAEDGKDPEDPTLWIYLTVAMALVLAGGAFAGLTIALMGQDEIYLQVIATSGEGSERKHAMRVLRLLKRGKHWVLVTLLLSNVITNETLPIVLDRSLGGGWPAVLGSTVLIVIFGEIIPQSICVRYGLPIGAWMSAPVLVLMYAMAPVAWPTAKLLDKLLGTDHGTTYKKAGLKTLVTLHKTLGEAGEQLNSDEVTIISAVLDLKDKPVGAIMTPMDDVFTMSADTILDENTMDIILSAGYSRIPIHAPDNPMNFIGMLLVKMLITYDPEDCMPVRNFALATLPETRPETSCLDIVNYFQEGKSHMVLVTDFPGEDCGALGVVTLEDVIEELIGEEIIDESDVFVDVHKAIRRLTPAPWTRIPKGTVVSDHPAIDGNGEDEPLVRFETPEGDHTMQRPHGLNRTFTADAPSRPRKSSAGTAELSRSPVGKFMLRRSSSMAGHSDSEYLNRRRANSADLWDQLKHLGPSNLASRPKSTRYTSVKIKPAVAFGNDAQTAANTTANATSMSPPLQLPVVGSAPSGGVGEGLVSDAGHSAKDGVMALHAGYGTLAPPPRPMSQEDSASVSRGVQVDSRPAGSRSGSHNGGGGGRRRHHSRQASSEMTRPYGSQQPTASVQSLQQHLKHHSRTHSASTLDSLPSIEHESGGGVGRRPARSGSITENYVEHGGFTKVVLEMSSSSEENANGGGTAVPPAADDEQPPPPASSTKGPLPLLGGGLSREPSSSTSRPGGESDAAPGAAKEGGANKKKHHRKGHHKKKKGGKKGGGGGGGADGGTGDGNGHAGGGGAGGGAPGTGEHTPLLSRR